jgi:type I restriction enzyme S subunit
MINLPNHQKLSSLSRNSECSGIRLKYGVELVNNRAETIFNYVGLENVESWKGKLVQSDNLSSEEDAATANRFYSENVLFGKLRPYLAKVFVAQQDGCCTSELLVLRPVKYYANYLKYLILNPDFINLVNSSTYGAKMPRASWDFIGNIFLPTPPIETQKLIATFLDSKTAAIDTLIDKKQRLIQLLEEKRTALINQAVTKGLNPNVPMKDSGIPWIGKIPEHWEIYHLNRVVKKFVDYRGKTPEKTKFGVPLITAGAIRHGEIDHSRAPEWVSEEVYLEIIKRGIPEVGDLLFTSEAPLGEVAIILDPEIALAQRVILFKVDKTKINSMFLKLHFLSLSGQGEIKSRASGSTAEGIRADRLKMSVVPTPPLEEQLIINSYVEERIKPHKIIAKKINSQIEKLQEYRRSLITAAVTGKLNIKEVETNV